MQSKDYVPGVSGFKVDLKTGQVEINEGNVRVKAAASMITYAGPGQSDDKAAKSELTARVTGEKTEPTSDFDKAMAEGDAGKILEMLVGKISETKLGQELTAQIESIEKADIASLQSLESRVASMETILASRFAMIDQLQTKIETEDQIQQALRRAIRPGGLLHGFNR